ncbi:DUF1456 family protein [Flavobacterium silvisoli]|uniref:DUF1456 family protein n=1 Tax=Flavobacterium silvisoli TaxID=2529433 RepID=A0A4Q9Z6W0_9FLAO|nr:DUF1456 family protein [Flavobacterium silvisoli]TBX70367.1 DUF1456 family protein [Flavobacterium silvisoli]
MNNNDIFKKLRVALQLRDDQIVEIMQLVDFRISAAELGAFFRNADHPKYMDCGDQVLRNFLNGLVIHLRGTKENPKKPMEVIQQNQQAVQKNNSEKNKTAPKTGFNKKPAAGVKPKNKKPETKIQAVEKVKFKNGKK